MHCSRVKLPATLRSSALVLRGAEERVSVAEGVTVLSVEVWVMAAGSSATLYLGKDGTVYLRVPLLSTNAG